MKPQLTFVAVLFLAGCLGSYGVSGNEIVREECLKPKGPDPCQLNTLKRHYYDPAEKHCNNYIIGGCNGVSQNFRSAEKCQEFCQKSPKEVCQQPLVKGESLGSAPRHYYDAVEKKCVAFKYTGFGGNDNNFLSAEGCQNFCAGV